MRGTVIGYSFGTCIQVEEIAWTLDHFDDHYCRAYKILIICLPVGSYKVRDRDSQRWTKILTTEIDKHPFQLAICANC